MSKTTITEALAEIKTIAKRIEAKERFVMNYLVRPDVVRDPHPEGSVVVVGRELQSLRDLRTRWMRLRQAIAEANAKTHMTILGIDRTIAEWLIWRREIADGEQAFIGRISSMIQEVSKEIVKQSSRENPIQPVVSVDERYLFAEAEMHQEVTGTLDGKLSLLNATTFVEVQD
jgi:hypothetical protein